jgi:stress response protein YsnF
MTDRRDDPELVIPVVEEQVRVAVRQRTTGRVRVSTKLHTRTEHVEQDLLHREVQVERVPVNRVVDSVPDLRREGDVTIIPVVEEVIVKQLILREEIRITEVRRTERFTDDVLLRRTEAVVERLPVEND